MFPVLQWHWQYEWWLVKLKVFGFLNSSCCHHFEKQFLLVFSFCLQRELQKSWTYGMAVSPPEVHITFVQRLCSPKSAHPAYGTKTRWSPHLAPSPVPPHLPLYSCSPRYCALHKPTATLARNWGVLCLVGWSRPRPQNAMCHLQIYLTCTFYLVFCYLLPFCGTSVPFFNCLLLGDSAWPGLL